MFKWGKSSVILFVVLTMFVGGVLQAQADPPDRGATEIGEAVYWEGVAGATAVASPNLPVASSDHFIYLPVAINQSLPQEVQAVLDLVNAERAQAGCSPLRAQNQLLQAAQGHSQDMALRDFFSHTSWDGRSPWDRIQATGYTYTRAGENIAAGYRTPETAVAAWMNSSGHRANILNCSFTETGVGYYYLQNDTGNVNYHHYWTQVFATP